MTKRAKPILRSERSRRCLATRGRMRDAAVRHILEHGFAGLTLNRLDAQVGVRHTGGSIYSSLDIVLSDMVREHQLAVGERMTEAVLASRTLTGPARVEALATALLDALNAGRDGHRATMAAVAGLPSVAHETRNADCWMHGVFAEAIGGPEEERHILGRSLLTLIQSWAMRLEDAEAETRAACARLLTRMVCSGG